MELGNGRIEREFELNMEQMRGENLLGTSLELMFDGRNPKRTYYKDGS